MKFNVLVVLSLSFPEAFADLKGHKGRNGHRSRNRKLKNKGFVPTNGPYDIPETSCITWKGGSACVRVGEDSKGNGEGDFKVMSDSCIGPGACTYAGGDGGDAKIGSYSCEGENACSFVAGYCKGEAEIKSNSCKGYQACSHLAEAGGKGVISDNACLGDGSCFFAFSIGKGYVGSNSCWGDNACYAVGATDTHVDCDPTSYGYAFIDENSCRPQADDEDGFCASGNDNNVACAFMGWCGKAKVGKNSCNGGGSCDFTGTADGISVGTDFLSTWPPCHVQSSSKGSSFKKGKDKPDYEFIVGDTSCRGFQACQMSGTFDSLDGADQKILDWKIEIGDYACIGDNACGCDLIDRYDSCQEALGLHVDVAEKKIKIDDGYKNPCGSCPP